ncbi:regulator of nonsense transcripts 3B [Parasteatoda tepidariorum]|uniref:regulator of nonsense transcripts 3B n=1 Tax=Parasteatoda tepidariorum TaxID=114398 RepID=UPI00077FB6D9|nr:regulator of nonsense transcripts 3B [Parasteatoda tepidariorum]
MKRDKTFQTKVIIRRLPPTMTEEQFIEQISPLPEHDYMYFVKADMRLGSHAFSRAYINFVIPEDIFLFKDQFDGYVFLDNKGNEYPAIVEFAPFQKIPKKRSKKRDAKCGTIANDPDYLKFLESMKNPDDVSLPSAEVYLEEIESREKELKANNGVPKLTTPLIEYLKARKIEQQKIREEKREERKRRELEKKRIREEERRRRKAEKDKERVKDKYKDKESLSEKEATDELEESPVSESVNQSDQIVQVLKNPEREKETKEVTTPLKGKEYFPPWKSNRDRDRGKKEWDRDRTRLKDKQKVPVKGYYNERERSRRDKTDYKLYSGRKQSDHETASKKSKEEGVKCLEQPEEELLESTKEKKVDSKKDTSPVASHSQWPKDKRDNSCPGNVETFGSQKDNDDLSSQLGDSTKSVSREDVDRNETSKQLDFREQGKDPRAERRIRNKDRPSLEIYRPGMRRFSTQRNSPQKEVPTSTSNSSSPSPTPSTTSVTKTLKDDDKNDKKIDE